LQQKRQVAAIALLVIVALVLGIALYKSAARPKDTRTRIVVWGLASGEETQGLDKAVALFEKANPDIKVIRLNMAAGGMDPQKLMTSIAGGVPPDVIYQDRFTIGDWASRGAFRPLDDLIERDGINPADFYPACWKEASYKGKVYAIPYSTDDRALYWNKTVFKKAGLDPERPPRTWSELEDYAKKLTKLSPDGDSFETIGFIPNYGNSWLYLYGWQNGGVFMSPDGRRCTLTDPRIVGALEWMVKVYDELGGAEKVMAFQSGFQPQAFDPFYIGKVAMKIDGNWVLNMIARYAPDLDFGVAPAPVPDDRYYHRPPFEHVPTYITWSGGFSLAIPTGSHHVEEAWKFIKWMTSLDGVIPQNEGQEAYAHSLGRKYVPTLTANEKINEVVFRKFAPKDPKFRTALRTFLDLMKVSKFRPVTFVGQRLWDEHVRAFDLAVYHKKSPKEALEDGQKVVQRELDKVFARQQLPLFNWKVVYIGAAILGLLCIIFGAVKVLKAPPLGRVRKEEAAAGFLFASPWIIGFLVLTGGPILASIVYSFCAYDVLHPARYVGFSNYVELVKDPIFLKALYNAAYLWFFGVPLSMMVGLAIAMLLNAKVRGMSWYRTIYYMPSIVPLVASAILWIWLFNPDYGLINSAWRATLGAWFHIGAPKWLADPLWSKPALILMGLWGAGAGMIIWLAGLQGVPRQLYEAAAIDGATGWKAFRHVTLPMLSPYIFFNLIMGTIGSLQRFVDIYVMTNGGPVDSTQVPVLYLFQNAFAYFKMGYASALAWLLFLVIMLLTLVQLKFASKWVYYEAEEKR